MNRSYLVIYDFYLLQNKQQHFGVNSILIKFLDDKRLDYDILDYEISTSILFLVTKKIPDILRKLKSKKYETIIAYNFLNALASYICKKILRSNVKIIFISLDFTKKRFGNIVLDKIYIFLDFIASLLSDEVWNSSYKVFEYRKKFINDSKNYYVPNLPNYKKKNLKKFDKFTILMISFLKKNYTFDNLIECFDYIKKNNINLFIIGEGELKKDLENLISKKNFDENIFLTGYLDHEEIKKLLEKSHLGLALYSGSVDHNFWGDSLKIREYTYYNLPVITNKNVYNYHEVEKENLGIVIDKNISLLESIRDIYENKKLYENIVDSTKVYNSKFKSETLLSKRINN